MQYFAGDKIPLLKREGNLFILVIGNGHCRLNGVDLQRICLRKRNEMPTRVKDAELMKKISLYAQDFFLQTMRSPTTQEIGDHFGINKSTAFRYLKEMDKEGMLSYDGKSIITKNIAMLQNLQSLPVCGVIPCGPPSDQYEATEDYISLPDSILGQGDFFALRASGDSMVDAGIQPGDIVIVKRAEEAPPEKIVAALIDGHASTLKRLKYDRETGRYYLHPENAEAGYPDIEADSFAIQGIAVEVLKRL